MNLLTILGTRPEIIRLYHTVKLVKPSLFWTGQNFSANLSIDIMQDNRFEDVYKKMVLSSIEEQRFAEQFSKMLLSIDSHIKKIKPDKILILGDTNSSLAAAIASKKNNVLLYHMEAGNRCYNPDSPEEVNRKMIDSIADVHLCYTNFAKQNLILEGVPINKIHVIGNPMSEFKELYEKTKVKHQAIVTIHRQENLKYLNTLVGFFEKLKEIVDLKLVLHPRYYNFFKNYFDVLPSLDFSSFIKMQQESKLIITDSGTVCEEAAILHKPCLIIRDTTERPELLELGGVILGDMNSSDNLFNSAKFLLNIETDWELPAEYKYQKVSNKVNTILHSKVNYL